MSPGIGGYIPWGVRARSWGSILAPFFGISIEFTHVMNLTGKAIPDIIYPVDEAEKRESRIENEEEKFW
jgi:hypothetical protein